MEASLFSAARDGNLTAVKSFLRSGSCDVNIRDESFYNFTPLHYACRGGHLDVARVLCEYNADPECRDKFGRTPLHLASLKGHADIIKYLCEVHCNIDSTTDGGETPLHIACREGHLDVARVLCVYNADPECRDVIGRTPLYLACCNGHTDVVKYLCEVHCNIDSTTVGGQTPLHTACRLGHLECVKILCQHNAKPDCADETGQTPLHWACHNGHTDVVMYLCAAHCKIDCADSDGETPLHTACREGHLDVARVLCECNADPECRDEFGQTPLHLACLSGDTDFVMYLCTAHCNIDSTTDGGETPLHYACQRGHLECVKILCQHNAKADCADETGWTPLHWACQRGHLECVKILCQHNAKADCADKTGWTPLHLACQYNRKDVVHYLLSEMHCNVNAVTEGGDSPLSLTNSVDIIQHLICYGASVKDVYIHYRSELAPAYQKQPTKSVVKTFVVGDPEAGKTTLVKALEIESEGLSRIARRFVKVSGTDQKTAGIIPHNIESQRFGRITFYDFTGHKEFYGSHAAVLQNTMTGSSAALFLLLADLRKDEEEFKQSILFWSSFIDNQHRSGDPKPHVIVVGSHADQVKSKAETSLKNSTIHSLAGTSAFANLIFAGFFPINCCYSESSAISELRQCIAKSCNVLRNNAELSFNCHCFLLYLHDSFRDTPALPIKEAVDRIRTHSADLPTTERTVLGFISGDFHTLYKLCVDLNDRGSILLLRSPHKPEESWIVLDQDLLLSRVTGTVFAPEGFKEHHSIANSTGVVPLSQLKSFFSDLDVNMLAHFLSHLEFCQEVSDKEVLQLLGTSESSLEVQERFFFFPALVSITAPDSVWQTNSKFSYYSGWMLQSSQAEQFFMPRFLQVLILRLAFSFALIPDVEIPSSDVPALQRKCKVWKNGLSWAGTAGVEALVEVVAQRRVNVILRCLKGREVACSRIRSTIIQKVRSAREEFCPKVAISELFIHPTDTVQYPLKPIAELNMVGYSQLAKAIVSAEPCVVDTAGRPVDLEELLHFEPYSHLGRPILCKLFDEQSPQNKELVTDDFLYSIADRAYQSKDKFVQLFNSPQTTMLHERISQGSPGPAHELFRVFQLWRDCSEGSYECLRKELDRFSVFTGRNPLDVAEVTCCTVQDPNHLHSNSAFTHIPPSVLSSASPQAVVADTQPRSAVPTLSTESSLLRAQQSTTGEVDSSPLGISDLYTVNSSIVGVTAKWLELGLSLGVSPSTLEVIEKEHTKDTSRCMTETLAAWLQKKGKDPNWRSLVTGLESLSIDRDIILKITREHGTLCAVNGPSPADSRDQAHQKVDNSQLNMESLADVRGEVLTLGYSWFEIGLSLGLFYHTLKIIESNNPKDSRTCLTETLKAWLRKVDMVPKRGQPSWRALAQALSSPLVGECEVANRISAAHSMTSC